jgi:hypothetical protein
MDYGANAVYGAVAMDGTLPHSLAANARMLDMGVEGLSLVSHLRCTSVVSHCHISVVLDVLFT